MKKTIITIVACIMSIASSWGQQEVNTVSTYLRGGMTYSYACDQENGLGYLAGMEFKYQMTKHQAISLGGTYNVYTAKETYDGTRDFSLHYVSIPLLYNYYIAKGLSVKTGIEGNIHISSKVDGEQRHKGVKASDMPFEKYLMSIAYNQHSVKLHKLRMAIPVGISYDYRKFCIDARFEIGLTNVAQHDRIMYSMNAFTLTAGMKL